MKAQKTVARMKGDNDIKRIKTTAKQVASLLARERIILH
jgi:hypothetical protein